MPTLTLDGDARGAVRATAQVTDATDKLTNSFKAAGQTSEQLAKQLQQAYNETPLDNYIRKCEELAQKVAAGKMSVDQYKAATDRMHQGLKEAGDTQDKTFGSEALGQLANYAAGTFGVAKAIQFVTSVMQEQREERERAAANVAGGLTGAGELANVSPSQASFTANLAIARQLMDSGIVPRDQQDVAMHAAAGIAASGASGGDQGFLLNLGSQRRVGGGQLGDFAQNISRVQQAYNLPASSFQGIGKQLIAAGSDTLGISNPSDIGRYLADVAPEAADAGMSPTEALAAFVTYARQTKSPKAAEALLKKQITEGNAPDGAGGAFYSQEVSKLQGAQTGAIPDYLSGDSRLSAARGAVSSKASADSVVENKYATIQSLATGVWEARRAAANQAGGLHPYDEGAYRGSVGYLLPNRSVLDLEFNSGMKNVGENTELGHAIEKYLGVPEGYWERQEKMMEEQNEIMKRGSRDLPPPSGLQE